MTAPVEWMRLVGSLEATANAELAAGQGVALRKVCPTAPVLRELGPMAGRASPKGFPSGGSCYEGRTGSRWGRDVGPIRRGEHGGRWRSAAAGTGR